MDQIRFERNLDTCVSLNRDAGAKRTKRNGTPHSYHAYSNICFDLWLLLHKQDYFRAETATDAYVDHVRSAFNLERNADIKREDVIEHILKQINLDDVKLAISRAERIVGAKCPEDRKYTAASNFYYPNPDFSIHTFIAKVIDDAQ